MPANAGDAGSVPGSGRSPGGGNGKPRQYSYQDNPMDRAAWRAAVYGGHKELDTTEHAHKCILIFRLLRTSSGPVVKTLQSSS